MVEGINSLLINQYHIHTIAFEEAYSFSHGTSEVSLSAVDCLRHFLCSRTNSTATRVIDRDFNGSFAMYEGIHHDHRVAL